MALQEELQVIGDRARELRTASRNKIADLEKGLSEHWGGQAAVPVLTALAECRRDLAELDAILGPSQVLQEELVRRTARQTPQK